MRCYQVLLFRLEALQVRDEAKLARILLGPLGLKGAHGAYSPRSRHIFRFEERKVWFRRSKELTQHPEMTEEGGRGDLLPRQLDGSGPCVGLM